MLLINVETNHEFSFSRFHRILPFFKNKIKMSKFHVFDGYNQGVRCALGTMLNA